MGVTKLAWAKNGTPDTKGSAGSTMAITDAIGQDFNMVMSHCINVTGDASIRMRLNADSGANYARRRSDNGGADSVQGSNTYSYWTGSASTGNVFYISYICGIAGEEKLMMVWNTFSNTAGAGNAPTRFELAAKWSNTSDSITSFDGDAGGSYFDTSSNISALGSDGVESLNVQDGAIFHETDTNKSYVLSSNTWTEL